MADAMRQIRQSLGDDAVIVSTQTDDDGSVSITAALESDDAESALNALLADDEHDRVREEIYRALDYHGVPADLGEAIMERIGDDMSKDATTSLEAGLKQCFDYSPIDLGKMQKPILLLGLPGAGKTVTTAKLATQAVMAKRPVSIISADGFRAGAREELSAFTDILDTDLMHVDTPAELRAAVAGKSAGTVTLIDSTGANPFHAKEMAALAQLVEAADAEPVLVLAAGGDTMEAAEIAGSFAAIGTRRMVVTRLDISRRLGAMLVVAEAGPLAFSDVSFSPQVARGLKFLTPQALARLLMRDPMQVTHDVTPKKALNR
jgi:flagellar biosynthesis protein FlhF